MVRGALASVPPRTSVLPPGAGNEAKKAIKPQKRAKKREDRYVGERVRVDGHVDAATIRRYHDGDHPAILPIELAQRGLQDATSARSGPCGPRSLAGFVGASTSPRWSCPHPASCGATGWTSPGQRKRPSAVPTAFIEFDCVGTSLPRRPTLTGFDDHGRAGQGTEDQGDPECLGSQNGFHHQQSHRIPAPTVRARDARMVNDQLRRDSLDFTIEPLRTKSCSPAWSAAGRSLARSLALRPRLTTGLP